ncbi:MAG: LysM domain-containing protein [Planctomycetota bacterium]
MPFASLHPPKVRIALGRTPIIALLTLLLGLAASTETFASGSTREYEVRPGETLGRIAAEQLGSAERVNEILALNPTISDPNRIRVGQVILLPRDSTGETAASDRSQDAPSDNWREQFREHAAELGILGAGLGIIFIIVACSVVVELVISLFIGALLLWLGAAIAGIERREFGAVFKANLLGSLWWGVALVGGLATAVFVPLPDLAKGILAVAAILILPWIVYVATVKSSLDTSALRAAVASLIAGVLPVLFAFVVFFGSLALNILPFVIW